MKPLNETIRPLPARRVFVVQVAAEADLAQGHWTGRIEHVVSGQAQHFQTLADLLGFMVRVLTGRRSEPPETPGGD